MSILNIVFLTLEGRHGPDGRADNLLTGKRLVSVDLNNESERGDIQRFFNPDDGIDYWGLGTAEAGWWKITGAYELKQPERELHEDKYQVSHYLTESQFSEIVKEANK